MRREGRGGPCALLSPFPRAELGFGRPVADVWTVPLPPGVREPFDVYVNGVPQQRGVDYERRFDELVFARPLAREGRLGFWRWFWGAWGIGTYRRDDQVDVAWEVDGRPQLAHGLAIEPPDTPVADLTSHTDVSPAPGASADGHRCPDRHPAREP